MNKPRLIFWELTKRCNLRCVHCRAESYDKEFDMNYRFRIVKIF